MAKSTRPRDVNQLAKLVVDMSTVNVPPDPASTKNAAALGKLGGAKGGPARATALAPAKRRAIAKKATAKRWKERLKHTAPIPEFLLGLQPRLRHRLRGGHRQRRDEAW
jgi:hypothetical protein